MKYVGNPVEVEAFTIVAIADREDDNGVDLTLDNDQVVHADSAMLSRMSPAKGDYWVVQADGYVYLNPKDVFERKYAKLGEQEAPMAMPSTAKMVYDLTGKIDQIMAALKIKD